MAEYNRGDAISTHCEACRMIKNKTVVASYICKDCKDFLCDECYTHHRATLLTMRHLLVPLVRPSIQRDVKSKQAFNQDDQPSTISWPRYEGQSRKAKVQPSYAYGGRDTTIVGSSDSDLEEYPVETTRHKTFKAGTSYRHGVKQAEVSGRKDKYDKNFKGGFGDQNLAIFGRMKNMRLDAGTSNTQTTRQTGKPYTTATLKHSFDVTKVNDEGNCVIPGLVILPDKLIVCVWIDKILKVYDSSYRFLYKYKCDDSPWDIDMLDVNTVVVSSESGWNIRLLSVGNDSMKEISKINTEYACYGVCCYEGKIYCVVKYYIGLKQFSNLCVYTPTGQLLNKFEHLSDGKVAGNDLQYITVNPKTGILYATDKDTGVLALSTNGDVIALMSHPELTWPRGIAVDDNGHIYVSGYESHNIIQLSLDEGSVVQILSGKYKCFKPVCVKIYGNKMFVSHRDGNIWNDKISIYQLF